MSNTKTCGKCNRVLQISCFCIQRSSPDGRRCICRVCDSRRRRAYYRKNRERELKYKRTHNKSDAHKKSFARYLDANPNKRKAKKAVNKAISRGKLERGSCCEKCGSTKNLHGHHDSYEPEHWLTVRWLCCSCHGAYHRKHDPEDRSEIGPENV